MKFYFLFLFLSFPLFFYGQSGGAIKAEVVTKGAIRTPIDSAKITAVVSGRDSLIGYTDSTGRCTIKPLAEGVYHLTIEKTGYVTSKISGIIVSDHKTTYISGVNGIELSPVEIVPVRANRKKKHRKH